jgi:hypothetical protein
VQFCSDHRIGLPQRHSRIVANLRTRTAHHTAT